MCDLPDSGWVSTVLKYPETAEVWYEGAVNSVENPPPDVMTASSTFD